jgi:hypothetical protein
MPLHSEAGFHLFVVGPDWADSYQLLARTKPCQTTLQFDIPPRTFTMPEIPNPLAANFNDEIKLLGYDLPTRRIDPGGRLPLTLYWQALATTGQDYRIFDNLLDSEQRRWGGYDRRARDGYSTLLWVPGEVITDPFGVPVDPAAPPGIYWLDIGLYDPTADGPVSLPLVEQGQPLTQSSVRIGPVKVGGPPPSVIITDPRPQVRLDQPFGDHLTLLGYDLTDQDNQPLVNLQSPREASNLHLTLYWRVEQSLDRDYTTFLHLRDAANQNVAQKDGPPANGQYPTSLWDTGEIIKDDMTLLLAEVRPGRYVPTIGLYDFASGDRLPVAGHPANELPLTAVEIR